MSFIYQKALDIPKISFSQRCLCKLHSCWCSTLALTLIIKLLFLQFVILYGKKKAPTIRPCRCNMTSKIPNHVWFLSPIFSWDNPVLDSDFSAVKHGNAWLKIYFHNLVILLVKGLIYQHEMDQDTAPHDNDPDFSSHSMKLGHIKDLSCCTAEKLELVSRN